MNKIASPQELQSELRCLAAYCGEQAPSRERLASELRALADRVADHDPAHEMLAAMTKIQKYTEDLVYEMINLTGYAKRLKPGDVDAPELIYTLTKEIQADFLRYQNAFKKHEANLIRYITNSP
jgi:hypothetical protein